MANASTDAPAFERLSAIDACFLYWDTESTPINMGNVCVFEGEKLFDDNGVFLLDDVRAAIASRLEFVPRYRMKVAPGARGISHPVLVDDPDFDITNHVRLIALPRPGTGEQLKEAFARIHEGTMDRSKPLWEIWFIEGLADGKVGMVQKIHHAPFDGQSTVDILERLLDHSPDTPVKPNPIPPARPAPSALAVVASELKARLNTVKDLALTGPYAPLAKPERWKDIATGLAAVARQRIVKPTAINAPNKRTRTMDWIHTDIDTIRKVRRLHPGATLNDVMLTMVARGMREMLSTSGRMADAERIRVFVPISLRSEDERDMEGGNRLGVLMVPLHVDIAEDLARLRAIHATTSEGKDGPQPVGFFLLMSMVDFLPPSLLRLLGPVIKDMRHLMNLTVTNVTGPREELYLLGAKMLELNPMLPLANQLGMNVAVESYAGKLSIGLTIDSNAVPNADPMKRGMQDALRELLTQANALSASAPDVDPRKAVARTPTKAVARTATKAVALDNSPKAVAQDSATKAEARIRATKATTGATAKKATATDGLRKTTPAGRPRKATASGGSRNATARSGQKKAGAKGGPRKAAATREPRKATATGGPRKATATGTSETATTTGGDTDDG